MSDLPPLPPLAPGRYRHYRGGDYEVGAVVRHSETPKPLVLYPALYGAGGPRVRPEARGPEQGRSRPGHAE